MATFLDALQLRLAGGIGFFLELVTNQRIDQRIDAADKEAGHAGNLADVSAAGPKSFDAVDIGCGDFFIDFLGEQQRHVDVDAFADELTKRRDALGRSGHLDHDVLAGHGFPQPSRFGERSVGVVRQIGRDFQAHVAVALLCALVHRAQQIGGVLNVSDGEQFVPAFGIKIGAAGERVEKILVFIRAGDGLFKDRGIGCHPAQAVFIDQALQFAALEQISADVVDPDGLAEGLKLLQRVGGFGGLEGIYGIHDYIS